MIEKTKLTGGSEKTITWIWLEPQVVTSKWSITISAKAQRMFGNDIAYTIKVDEMNELFTE